MTRATAPPSASEHAVDRPAPMPALAEFWSMDRASRDKVLLDGIAAAHAYHFVHNTAYRNTVAARGVGCDLQPSEMPRLLRTTSQAFRSYIDVLGTPFPQDRPAAFVDWLADQVSVDLHPEKHRFRDRYWSLGGLLKAIEKEFADLDLELLTSGWASGRMAIVPRDPLGTGLAAESLGRCFQRYLGLTAEHTAILMTPKRTRAAVARMTRLGLLGAGLLPENIRFAVPLPESPDQARVRAGLTCRPGLRGAIERRLQRPLTRTLQDRLVDAQAVESAVTRLIPASAHEERVLLVGSLGRLHMLASFLLDGGRTITLAPGSVLVTLGNPGDAPAKTLSGTPAEMREDLRRAFRSPSGEPVPVRDVYALAEANWVAVQCAHGSYHIPPWVHAVTVDDRERFQTAPRSTGLLAFFDPCGGGDLLPAFFRTPDRVTLVRDGACPCGEAGDYLEEGSITRTTFGGVAE